MLAESNITSLDCLTGPMCNNPMYFPEGLVAVDNDDLDIKNNEIRVATTGYTNSQYNDMLNWESRKNLLKRLKDHPELLNQDTLGYGKLIATKHANGRDWWIVINESHTNRFYKILLDINGVSVYENQTVGMTNEEGLGQAVFSPDGAMYVMFNAIDSETGQFLEIYDFDRCNGNLSNHRRIHLDIDGPGGVAISPNSRYLYASSYIHIYQFDLWSNDIESSKDTVAVYDGFQSPFPTRFYLSQLAPDGKIYINCNNSSDILHVIHEPNEQGMACNVEQHGIQLLTNNAFSLPNYPNYRLGALPNSPCDSLISNSKEIEDRALKIYPNPASLSLSIDFEYNDVEKVCLFSTLGEKVFEEELKNAIGQIEIDVSGLPSGIYHCTLFTKTSEVRSKSVVIVR